MNQSKPLSTVVLLLLLGGLFITIIVFATFFYKPNKSAEIVVSPQEVKTETVISQANLPQFAEFKEEAVNITPVVPQYSLETNQLTNLSNVEKAGEKKLTQEQLKALIGPGFFLQPAENLLKDGEKELDFSHGGVIDEFLIHYKEIAGESAAAKRQPENTVFVTSDLLLHVFHVYLDRTFQHIEETKFHPKLLTLSGLLFDKSLAEIEKSTDPQVKNSFTRLATFYLVPKVILETSLSYTERDKFAANPDEAQKLAANDEGADKTEKISAKLEDYKTKVPEAVYQKAKAEIELIEKATGAAISPLYGEFREGQMDDYSQYKPRSHYTKSSLLRSYWKAMIWYGRNAFLIKSEPLTQDAIIQTILLTSVEKENQKALTLWENIYLPTVFFVGKSDDLTVYDYRDLVKKVYGDGVMFGDIASVDKLKQFTDEVKKLPGPLIQSSIVLVGSDETKQEALAKTKGFRFMGQRFIPDSFIFSTLTQGDEAPDAETGQKLPSIPTALMPMSIFGSSQAQIYLDQWVKENAPDSDKVIAKEKQKLEKVFNGFDTYAWTQNLYWSWLYTLKSLFTKFAEGYPQFMQTDSWSDKDLNTALGSWTELRHDTLLYAKQSYAELGGGGEQPTPPAVPKGYVEPNLVFLNRVIALAKMTKDGLEKNGVMPEEQKWKADQMVESFTFFKTLAEKELQNTVISDEDFEKLRLGVVGLNNIITPPSTSLSYIKAREARAGLIADVHTAINEGKILYEATGIPSIIYVAVKDANGTRLTRGVVYSYFEFTRPFGERLSDSDWQAVIYEGNTSYPIPQAATWIKALEK